MYRNNDEFYKGINKNPKRKINIQGRHVLKALNILE